MTLKPLAATAGAPPSPAWPTDQVAAANERGAHADRALAFVEAARQFLGQPYAWGAGHSEVYGTMPTQVGVQPVDCSGLVGQAAAMVGANLDGVAKDQRRMGPRVPLDEVQPGDLLFRPRSEGGYHVAIYAGEGMVIEAPHTGAEVRELPYDPGAWTQATRPWVGQAPQAALPSEPVQLASLGQDAADTGELTQRLVAPPPFAFD